MQFVRTWRHKWQILYQTKIENFHFYWNPTTPSWFGWFFEHPLVVKKLGFHQFLFGRWEIMHKWKNVKELLESAKWTERDLKGVWRCKAETFWCETPLKQLIFSYQIQSFLTIFTPFLLYHNFHKYADGTRLRKSQNAFKKFPMLKGG